MYLVTGESIKRDPEKTYKVTVKLVEDRGGKLLIWKHPEPGKQYVIGGDIGEGIGNDYHDLCVLMVPEDWKEPLEQVAVWHSNRTVPADVGLIAWRLGLYYNEALVGLERNGSAGGVSCQVLSNGDTRYPWTEGGYGDIYYEEKFLDDAKQEKDPRDGWATTPTTKPFLLHDLQLFIQEEMVIFRHVDTIRQLMGITRDPEKALTSRELKQTEKDPVTKQYNDDCVMSSAIAVQMAQHVRKRYFRKVETWG